MEKSVFELLSVKEKVIQTLKDDERSTYWLARKTGMSQGYVHLVLFQRPDNLSPKFVDKIKEVWPHIDFSEAAPELLPHEQLETDKQRAKKIWKKD